MRKETVKTDVTVVGGGLAGVCAAIAAARLGQTVALVNNRPVLGGNSSSEVRVWVCGATSHGIHRYARETGIMGELFVENQYRNKDGNPYLWDMVVLEAVQAEPNIQLFLNTDVHEAEAGEEAGGGRQIRSVTGWMMGSERSIRFESPVYLDCTGDGLVGFLAGAEFRMGREARDELGEEWAPLVADDITLGSTLLFYTKDAGHPVKYIAPAMAIDITQTSITENRIIRSGDNGCAYWWIEFGGEQDTVHDNEAIRDELWSIIYGIWDYIKNSGKFDAGNMTLEWVGSLPGKREYRRFVGDYILNQNDILAQREFADRIGFGGWSIDLHPPQGVYATESGSKHMYSDGSYHIPFRSLYSVNVNNLLMAGRDISASHVAFGTTRVMATCAVIGEAAGTGAALCAAKGVTPRELHANHLKELQQTMLRQDASILGLNNEDEADLALQAAVSASSERSRFAVEHPAFSVPLTTDIGITLPVDPLLDGIELLIDASEAAELTVQLWETGRPENYVPYALLQSASASVKSGNQQWVKLDLHWQPETPRNAFLIIKANAAITLHMADQPTSGILAYGHSDTPVVSLDFQNQPAQPVVLWDKKKFDHTAPCIRLSAPSHAFAAVKATDGYLRPYGGPHLWSSEQLESGREEWLELAWTAPVTLRQVHVTFNDDVNEDLINLHHHITPYEILPTLVKDYRIEAYMDGNWTAVAAGSDNHKRKHVHTLAEAVTTDRLRVIVLETNGSEYAEIIEVRVYE
ncbi:pyridine nucleotide-disulfide oxidoreductase [Paenibacillus sp. IHB B 3415]|uniref:FAD-dependent oxidoreductase n=1 Tax=Paenibacillus sp. IHB B 3415 TaxID=867080 RepID=UPI0005730BC7|nr:FAD-dependent oxidoreductase [Paenibacillus sp. IHB B 3415]KHL93461.1 pyridine nucleotide-disulfide oxidoreductase [Paenibacillus sp. IHB B 3415]